MSRLTWLLVCSVTVVHAANLLSNPGFELWQNDSTPQAWQVESRSRTGVDRELDTIRSGSFACGLTRRYLSAGNNYGIKQRVAVEPNTDYPMFVSVWDNNPEVSVGIGVSWLRTDTSYISASSITYSRDVAGWQRLADTVRSPAEAGYAEFRIRTYAPSGMTQANRVLVDDAVFGEPDARPADTVCTWFSQDSLGKKLIAFFGQARASIDFCCYNCSRMDVVQALLDAHVRGVRVRIVTDNTRMDDSWVIRVQRAGIKVISDAVGTSPNDLMHNKFAVRDLEDADSTNDRVWAASYNPNALPNRPNEGELRADFALEIPHSGLARAFRAEFEQMWGGSGPNPVPESARFHKAKKDVLPTHQFLVDGYPAYLYFGPQDRPVDSIAARVSKAAKHVLFAIFSFTHDGLGDAMIARWRDSVWVGGVIDRSGLYNQGSEYPRMVTNGMPVYEDSFPFGEKILHEKIMVIDSTVTVAGSANWSSGGNQANDEYVMIFRSPGIAKRFLAELTQRFWEATHPGVKERQGMGFRGQGWGLRTTHARSLDRLPRDALVMNACGRAVQERKSPAPGVYYVIAERPGKSPATDAAVLRRVVVVR